MGGFILSFFGVKNTTVNTQIKRIQQLKPHHSLLVEDESKVITSHSLSPLLIFTHALDYTRANESMPRNLGLWLANWRKNLDPNKLYV